VKGTLQFCEVERAKKDSGPYSYRRQGREKEGGIPWSLSVPRRWALPFPSRREKREKKGDSGASLYREKKGGETVISALFGEKRRSSFPPSGLGEKKRGKDRVYPTASGRAGTKGKEKKKGERGLVARRWGRPNAGEEETTTRRGGKEDNFAGKGGERGPGSGNRGREGEEARPADQAKGNAAPTFVP